MLIDGEDGITHINVYSKGKTEVGRFLSNFSYSPIIIDNLLFNSIEGYWYYIITDNILMCDKYGQHAKMFGKTLPRINEIDPIKIKSAIDIKLKNYINRLNELLTSNLPLAHYYVYNGKKKDAGSEYDWIIEHIEYRRQQLKTKYGYSRS